MGWQVFLNSPLAVWAPILILVIIVIIAFRKQIGTLIKRLTKTGIRVGKDGVLVDIEAQEPSIPDKVSSAPPAAARGVSVSHNKIIGHRQRIQVRHNSAEVNDNELMGTYQDITVTSDSPLVAHLYQQIILNLSVNDFRTLCMHLGQDYAALPGARLEDKAQSLLAEFERQQRLSQLVDAGRRLRPELAWEIS